mgnify:CR=1 FL=1
MTVKFSSLASGSSGNCHFISNGRENLLVDAGLSGKRIQQKLEERGFDPQTLTGILISHEHNDHILGAGILSRRFDVPIYANEATWQAMEDKLGKIKPENRRVFATEEHLVLEGLEVLPYGIPHDAAEPVGFILKNKTTKISIATDLGYIDKGIIDKIQDSDLVILESNHDVDMLKAGSYPYYLKRRILSDVGHLSNEAAGDAIVNLIKKNVKRVLLAHLSKENNFPELAMMTIKNILSNHKINMGKDVFIDMAHRDKVNPVYVFEG